MGQRTELEVVEGLVPILDERYPGWSRVVNVDTLNIEDTELCLLAQIGYGVLRIPLATAWKVLLRDMELAGLLQSTYEVDAFCSDKYLPAWREVLARPEPVSRGAW